MTAKLIVAAAAVVAAALAVRAVWGTDRMLQKIAAALVGIGLAAYGLALVVANGSC